MCSVAGKWFPLSGICKQCRPVPTTCLLQEIYTARSMNAGRVMCRKLIGSSVSLIWSIIPHHPASWRSACWGGTWRCSLLGPLHSSFPSCAFCRGGSFRSCFTLGRHLHGTDRPAFLSCCPLTTLLRLNGVHYPLTQWMIGHNTDLWALPYRRVHTCFKMSQQVSTAYLDRTSVEPHPIPIFIRGKWSQVQCRFRSGLYLISHICRSNGPQNLTQKCCCQPPKSLH